MFRGLSPLFLDRAHQTTSAFNLLPSDMAAMIQIVQQLDGLPLAIELAASKVRSLSVEEIRARLNDRFRLLKGNRRQIAPRQQTLSAMMDWSYDLLKEQEKRLLCRLSVFTGGWMLEAAEKICVGADLQDWEVLDVLTSLVDKSLVVGEQGQGRTRYRLLETVHQYSRERLLESGDADRVRRRHRDYFLSLAEEAQLHLEQSGQTPWSDRLEVEHNNLRAALVWCPEEKQGAEVGLRLAGTLSDFWFLRGYLREGRQHLAAALTRVEASHPGMARVKALNGTGRLASLQGDYTASQTLFEELLSLTRNLEDSTLLIAALTGLGFANFRQGDFEAARMHLLESLVLSREMGNTNSAGFALNCLGVLAHLQGDYTTAHSCLEEAVAIAQASDSLVGIANSCVNLGTLEQCEGRFEQAKILYIEALNAAKEAKNLRFVADCLEGLAGVCAHQGQAEQSIQLFGAAESIGEVIGAPMQAYHREINGVNLTIARSALTEESFAIAWRKGHVMSPEQAIGHVLMSSSLSR